MVAPTLNEWEFQLSDDGQLMGSGLTYDVSTIDGLDSPEVRTIEQDRDGSDGSYVFAQFTKSRSVAINGFILFDPSDPFKTIDALKANWQPNLTALPLYFRPRGQTQRVVFGYPLGVRYPLNADFNAGYVAFQAQLLCEDPRIYDSSAIKVGPVGMSTATGGRSYPKIYPHAYGTVSTGGTFSVVNAGNTYAFPTIIIDGAATTPILRSVTTDVDMRFNIVLSSTDRLVIDTALRTVKFNGADRIDVLNGVNFIKLNPGTNDFVFSAQNFTTSGQVSILYRNAYR